LFRREFEREFAAWSEEATAPALPEAWQLGSQDDHAIYGGEENLRRPGFRIYRMPHCGGSAPGNEGGKTQACHRACDVRRGRVSFKALGFKCIIPETARSAGRAGLNIPWSSFHWR